MMDFVSPMDFVSSTATPSRIITATDDKERVNVIRVRISYDKLPLNDRLSSAHSATQLIEVGGKESFSLDDIEAMFGEGGRRAMRGESEMIDAELTAKLLAKKITPLAYYRRMRGVTQEALASQSETTQSYLSQLERGRRAMTLKQAAKLAPVLGVKVHQLTGEE